jgi:hypothetical protein
MARFMPFSRDRAFPLPPDAKDWLPADDLAHFVVAALGRLPLGAFAVRPVPGGKARYHPPLLLALPVYCYANGLFASRRIERAKELRARLAADIADRAARAYNCRSIHRPQLA